MKFLFNIEPWVAILSGTVLSILLWVCVRPPKFISAKTIPLMICLFGIILLIGGGYYARKTYTYVPQIYLKFESLSSVREKLEKAGLICLDNNITPDIIAQAHLNNGKDINDNSFKVTNMNYNSNAFLKQGTAVNVSITWLDNFRNPSNTWQGDTEFNPEEYYSDISLDSLYSNNSNLIVISTALAGSKSTRSGYYSPELGAYPTRKEYIIVEVELFYYFNPELSWRKVGYVGEQFIFSDLPDGIYYYMAYSNGYKLAFAPTLIKIEQQENVSELAVGWGVNLERIGGTYSDSFYIKLENSRGHALSDVTVKLLVTHSRDSIPDSFTHYTLVSNEDGLLTSGDEVVDFQLFDNCYIQLFFDSVWEDRYIVQEPDENGIAKCIIPSQ